MIKFSYFSNRCKRLNEEIHSDIPFILEKIDTYKDLKPVPREDRVGPILYEEEINNAARIIRNIQGFNPTLLDKNIRSVTTSRLRHIHSADYDILDNHMRIGSKNSIPHETVHLGSSFYDIEKEIVVSGFSYVDNDIIIGRPFTEGYTELLTIENFDLNDYIPSYHYFVKYAKLFRDSFPTINMNKLFSEGNLNILLEEISKLGIPKEETMTYIYLLGKFKFFNFSLIEGYLNEYIEDFKEKIKRIK